MSLKWIDFYIGHIYVLQDNKQHGNAFYASHGLQRTWSGKHK